VTQFPSIRQKISQMEEESKMVTKVPDVKRKLDLGELKPAGWMEARKKLQSQLDVLLTKTSAKMNVLSKKEEEKEKSPAEKTECEESSTEKKVYPEVDSHVKSLIKSVAHEIQKSFSQRNLDLEDQMDADEKDEDEEEEEKENIIDCEQTQDNNKNEIPLVIIETSVAEEPTLEAPIDFESTPIVLDTSINREKMKIVRKSSRERRLPASIIAKKIACQHYCKEESSRETQRNNYIKDKFRRSRRQL